jgi:methylated-DNA-[protein]-cysteine S-methyltransferase
MGRYRAVVTSAVDDVVVEVNDVGVIACGFRRGAAVERDGASTLLDQVVAELGEYFAGDRKQFTVPVVWDAMSAFQRSVLQACAAIPFAESRTYGELADEVGTERPEGPRAVGQALRHNPVGIVVPCHRVVGSGGQLVGYAGGPDTGGDVRLKQALLEHERRVAGLTLF